MLRLNIPGFLLPFLEDYKLGYKFGWTHQLLFAPAFPSEGFWHL